MKNCIWCNSTTEDTSTVCPVCKLGQIIKVPDSRIGKCNCKSDSNKNNSGRALLVTVAGNGHDDNYCANCITQPIAMKLADELLSKNAHFPNTIIADKVASVSKGSGRLYRYKFKEQVDALEVVVCNIHMAKEKFVNHGPVTD